MSVAVAAKPKDLRDYYAALDAYAEQGVTHEGTVRSAFQHLLAGIPPDVFAYRLGNRSAVEWVIDQYRVKTDKRSGIRSDPNRLDDEEYIVRLVCQVVRVSLETVKIVRGLPKESGG